MANEKDSGRKNSMSRSEREKGCTVSAGSQAQEVTGDGAEKIN